MQQWSQQLGMVVPGVVQNDHYAFAVGAPTQQQLETRLEGLGVKRGAQAVCKLAPHQTHRAQAGHRLARGGVAQNWIFDLGCNPHATARAMLLEVALVQTAEFNIFLSCQTAQFF